MTLKLCSFALLAALTTAATAQTTPTAKPKALTTPHHTAAKTATAKTASNIPHVAGIAKTLYALKYIDIKVGTGPLAVTHKWYTVHYTGWFPDGTKFDSSFDHPGAEPITFPYGAHQVIYGWDTGFEGMHVGGKRRLFVPYELAYGELGNPPRMPAKANLVFDVELLGQSDNPPARPEAAKPATEPARPATEAAPDTTPKETPETKPATPETQPQATPNPETH